MSTQNTKSVAQLALDYAENKRTGCLEVQYGLLRGEIHFQFGQIIQAEFDGKKGPAALYDLLQLENAHLLWHDGLMPIYVSMTLDLADVIRDLNEIHHTDEEVPQEPIVTLSTNGQGNGISNGHTPPPGETLHIMEGANAEREENESSLARNYLVELTWINSPSSTPQVFLLEDNHQACYLIGSSPFCQITIDDPSVEPIHCSLLVHDNNLEVWDVGTDRQTSLNGKVIEMGVLEVGDVLMVGEASLKFELLLRRMLNGGQSQTNRRQTLVRAAGRKSPPSAAITYDSMDNKHSLKSKNPHEGALHHIFSGLFQRKVERSVLAERAHRPGQLQT